MMHGSMKNLILGCQHIKHYIPNEENKYTNSLSLYL